MAARAPHAPSSIRAPSSRRREGRPVRRSSRPGVVLGDGCVLHAHAVVRGPTTLGAAQRGAPLRGRRRRAAGQASTTAGRRACRAARATCSASTSRCTAAPRGARRASAPATCSWSAPTSPTTSPSARAACWPTACSSPGTSSSRTGSTFGGLAGVAQFVRVGRERVRRGDAAASATCRRSSSCRATARACAAVNAVGLRRRGVPEESIRALARAVRQALPRRHHPRRGAPHARGGH